ncbi:DUF1236 domain-containing protein [Rhizobium halophilum]|uniref:DUF1236 domain-containing protein n=1 Tax=Rhizobium halophilum TaxID=2846852 RepID=UPI001EFD1510|nr:DUF1236 domain-containing protein [Rhizobium halophilum]MCF6371336.1 DUF1236 domain-containing protein [Rhizobium halophilum]
MTRSKIRAVVLALLAGSALSGAAMAQDSSSSGTKILPQGSASGGAEAAGSLEAEGGVEQNQEAGATQSTTAEPVAPVDSAEAPEASAQDTDAAAQQQSAPDTEAGDSEAADSQSGEPDAAQASTEAAPSEETTASIDISAEQKTEIQSIIVEQKVEPVDIDVEVSIGTAIPKTVTLHPLPPRIVEIVPAYSGYEYFILADGRVVIVKPATHEVVYILVV